MMDSESFIDAANTYGAAFAILQTVRMGKLRTTGKKLSASEESKLEKKIRNAVAEVNTEDGPIGPGDILSILDEMPYGPYAVELPQDVLFPGVLNAKEWVRNPKLYDFVPTTPTESAKEPEPEPARRPARKSVFGIFATS